MAMAIPSCSSSFAASESKSESKFRKLEFPIHPVIEDGMNNPKSGPIECVLTGFDNQGHAFIRLVGKEAVEEHNRKMRDVWRHVYETVLGGPSLMAKGKRSRGDVVAAQVPERGGKRFIRGQVLEVCSKSVIINDLDSQLKFEVGFKKLFLMVKELFEIPLMTVMCSMRYIHTFSGTSACTDAAKAKACLSTEYFMAKVYKNKRKPRIPLVELYHNPDEYETRTWSFNMDLISQMITWNGTELDLDEKMVLEKVRVVHVLPDGHIWIQLQSGVLDALVRAKPKVNLTTIRTSQMELALETQMKSGRPLYMMRYQSHDQFVRALLVGRLGDDRGYGEVVVEYYDFGLKDVVYKSELIPAEYFDSLVMDIPSQLLIAKITTVPIGGFKEEDIQLLVSKSQKKKIVIKKVFREVESRCPEVDVYIRKSGAPADPSDEDLTIPGINCVVHSFPCKKHELKLPGRFFEFSFDHETLHETCSLFSPRAY